MNIIIVIMLRNRTPSSKQSQNKTIFLGIINVAKYLDSS